jgi:hypothetical protein
MTNCINKNIYSIRIITLLTLGITLCLCHIPLKAQVQEEIQLANEYLLKGDKKKALELYRDLAKNDVNTSFIYNNYINVLVDLGTTKRADKTVMQRLLIKQ